MYICMEFIWNSYIDVTYNVYKTNSLVDEVPSKSLADSGKWSWYYACSAQFLYHKQPETV